MIVTALRELGADPSFVNGGVIAGLGRSAASGTGELFVVEADESDGSFLLYDTAVALITNVDADHLDHYGTQEAFEDAFVTFAQRASEFVVASSDDPGTRAVTARAGRPAHPDLRDRPDADVRVSDIGTEGPVDVHADATPASSHRGAARRARRAQRAQRRRRLHGAGRTRIRPRAPSSAALETFAGTGRRFELHGTVRGVRVYDDYAHHPTEVEAALQTARSVVGRRAASSPCTSRTCTAARR